MPTNGSSGSLVRLRGLFASKLKLAFSGFLIAVSASAQQQPAPGNLWHVSTTTPVIAIDAQTNFYTSLLGSIVKLGPDGTPINTNNMCSAGGIAQRDAAGNFIFAGLFQPPITIGTTTLTNNHCFIAKFDATGTFLWAQSYVASPGYLWQNLTDLQLDPAGNAYVSVSMGASTLNHLSLVYKFTASGSNVWSSQIPQTFSIQDYRADSRIGGLTTSNGYAIDFTIQNGHYYACLAKFDTNGGMQTITYWGLTSSSSLPMAWHPVVNSAGEVFNVEGGPLVKRDSSGNVVWINFIPGTRPHAFAADIWGGVYVSDDTPYVAHYDSDGNLVWNLSMPFICNGLVSDAQGNRALSLGSGPVWRLAPDVLTLPIITTQPVPQTIMAGSNVSFSVTSTGSTPQRFFWQQGTNVIQSGTNTTLTLANVTTNQAGLYSVTISNFVGLTNSAQVLLRVKNVELFLGNQLLTNGTYLFTNTPVFTVRSTFTNGSAFYTLDGSAPTFLSNPYSNPFSVISNATIRAIGYSADFSQSEEADIVIAIPPVLHNLSASTAGGGTVTLNPPGGTYASSNTVTATATPAAGFTFLRWTGDAAGNISPINVTMERDKSIQAVFGTSLSNTIAGNGQVFIYPPIGPYPYGSVVRLNALPQSGNCFGTWGNAASGSTNPLFYTIASANPVISAAFAPTPGGDAALTVLISGGGNVNASPAGNFFPLNQSVSLTAVPNAGKTFLGWSGDASGTNNPLNVSLNQSKVITANFTGTVTLFVNPPAGDGLSAQGFKFSLSSDQQGIFQIQSSTDLSSWQNAGTVTNVTGDVQFTDPPATNKTRFYKIAPGP